MPDSLEVQVQPATASDTSITHGNVMMGTTTAATQDNIVINLPMTADGPSTSSTLSASLPPARQDVTDAQLTFASTAQEHTQTTRQSNEISESRMSLIASTQPSAAALQVVQPVRTPAGPELAAAEPMPSKLLWHSIHMPKWNDAISRWQADNPKGYLELEEMTDGVLKSPDGITDALSRYQPASTSSNQITARLKRWQSTLAAIRGIGMSVAVLDPHKIAPIICASVFFSLDVSKSSLSKK